MLNLFRPWLVCLPAYLQACARRGLLGLCTTLLAGLFGSTLASPVQAQYPGLPFAASSEASDLKPGSALFYNLYISDADNPGAENTALALTNIHTATAVTVRLFFISASGQHVNGFVRLAPRQTVSLLASEIDPGVRGYVLAVAVHDTTACPIQFNHLVGEANVKFASGQSANLSAVAIAALSSQPAACGGSSTTLAFDGASYNRLPRAVSLDNFASIAEGNNTLLVINRAGGDLTPGGAAATTGTLFGLVYDDAENVFSFSLGGATQVFGTLSDNFPRTTPRLSIIVPPGRSGWMKFFKQPEDVALLGAVLNFNPNTALNAFNSGHNMTHRTLTAVGSYTLPLTGPELVVNKTHTGNFTPGSTAVYNISVTNNGAAMAATANTITINDQMPGNLTLAGFSGMGWNCNGVGTANVTCSIVATLPGGASTAPLSLTVNVGAGTPIGPNSITNTVTVSNFQDSNLTNNSASDATTVVCQNITVNPATLPAGVAGTAYSQNVTQTGGFGLVNFNVTTGALPPGLSLSSGGALSGTPTQAGTFNFTVTATDASVCTGARAYTIVVTCPNITLLPSALPGGATVTAYSQTLTASGGTVPYDFTLDGGALPLGLALSLTGNLTGVPTQTGTFSFAVKATAANGCAGVQSYTVTISCGTLTLSPASLPAGSTATVYSQNLSANGTAPFNFSLSAGTLPSSLALNPNGLLAGTPTQMGSFTFTVQVTDANNCTGMQSYTLAINCSNIVVNPVGVPNGLLNLPYPATSFSATGGVGPHTFSLSGGTLPTGLSLSNGVLSGTLTQVGSFNFTITATDAAGCSGTRSYTLNIRRNTLKADFDGDGKTDLSVWRGPATSWLVINSSNGTLTTTSWGTSEAPFNDLPTPGDYDGDGKTDVAVFRRLNGIWYIRRSSDGATQTRAWGLGSDIPTPGDFDGDGKTDIAVWRPSNGTWYIIRSSDGSLQIEHWGTEGDTPVAVDYDGDGRTDVAVWRGSNTNWYIKRSTGGLDIISWGSGAAPYFDVPVAADYDGDGKADIAVWRGGNSTWYIRPSSTPNNPILREWGASYAPYHDVPVAGDYDGDGKADIAVWRPLNGTWYVIRSTDGTLLIQAHGQAGDTPVPNR